MRGDAHVRFGRGPQKRAGRKVSTALRAYLTQRGSATPARILAEDERAGRGLLDHYRFLPRRAAWLEAEVRGRLWS
jgi:hypothetical protein